MTLARITNYVDGNILTGAQLNNEFDNILNNGPALVGSAVPLISRTQGLSGSLVSNIGSFAANAYQLRTTSAVMSLSATSSFSVNTQTAGPIVNGKDQAAAFASTTVHFYAITTGLNSTVTAGIVSTKPPPLGPTLPTGYSAWAYLASAIYTIASSVLSWDWRVSGAKVSLKNNAVLGPGTAIGSSEKAVILGAHIPAIATRVYLQNGYTLTATAAGTKVNARLTLGSESSPATGSYDLQYDIGGMTTAGGTLVGVIPCDLANIETAPTIYGVSTITVGLSAANTPTITGYTVPNGDVS